MGERKPFPEIARYPEEVGDFSAPQEPPLEGAPQPSVEDPTKSADSIFAVVPGLAEVANCATGYDEQNKRGREVIAANFAQQITRDPDNLERLFDNLALLQEGSENLGDVTEGVERKRAYPAIEALKSDIEEAIDKIDWKKAGWPPSPENLGKWLNLSAESEIYGGTADKIMTKMVERCKNPRMITEFLYNLSLAGLRSSNEQIVQKTLGILCFQSDIMPVDSDQALDSVLALFDEKDDVLTKAIEIDGAINFTSTRRFPSFWSDKETALNRIMAGDKAVRAIQSKNKGPEEAQRLRDLFDFYDNPVDDLGIMITPASRTRQRNFPYNLVTRDNPLREWLNGEMARELDPSITGGFMVNLSLPGESVITSFSSPAELRNYLTEKMQDQDPDTVVESARCFSTLAYLEPGMSAEELISTSRLNRQIIEEMKWESQYLLSPRGDEVEITDPEARELGFKSILYKMNPGGKSETIVEINVGNCIYRCLLDEHLSMREVTGIKGPILMPMQGAYLDYLVLSHLREIRCTDRTVVSTGSGNKSGGIRQKSPRRPHRRRLPAGHKPQPEQIRFVLEDYGIDLVRMNREREAAGKGRITFVREVEDIQTAGPPVKCKAPLAMDNLQRILQDR